MTLRPIKDLILTLSAGLIFLVLASAGWARQQVIGPDVLLLSDDSYQHEQALQNALEFNKTGFSTSWESTETDHKVKVTPTVTYKNYFGQDCRNFYWSVTLDGETAVSHSTRCRSRSGVWINPQPIYSQNRYYLHPHYSSYRVHYYPYKIHLSYYYRRHLGHRVHRHRVHRHRVHRHRGGKVRR